MSFFFFSSKILSSWKYGGYLNTCLIPDVPRVVCSDEEFIISTSVNESSFFLHPHGCTILLTTCIDVEY